MAIINARMKQLRGPYADFDKSKALDGEFQVVTANDPNVPSGKAVYIAFAAGDVRRLVSIEDIEQMVADGKFKGDKGDKGDTGNGIARIEFVSSSTVTSKSTYKIIFTDGTSYTYSVNDGKSAYTYAKDGGYSGSETQFYSDLGTLRNIVTAEAEREQAEAEREAAFDAKIEEVNAETQEAINKANTATTNANNAASNANAATSNANATAAELIERADSGEFDGPQGPQGPPGESGVVTPTNGFFTLAGDSDGNLWAYYNDADNPPSFEVDSNGNIYYNTPNS